MNVPFRLLPLVVCVALTGCAPGGLLDRLFRRPPPVVAVPHYVVGDPYQSTGVWFYPRETFEYDESGLGGVEPPHGGLTSDGEVADGTAMVAAHPTLQLPALVRVTNLETGLAVVLRVNDRGQPQPGRLIAVSPRAAALLGMQGGVAQLRVQVLEAESRALAARMDSSGPHVAVQAAPLADVASESLAPPPGASQSGHIRAAPAGPAATAAAPVPAAADIPLRLPEQVLQYPPHPGTLFVEAGTFSRPTYADVLRARLARLGAQTVTDYNAPRDRAYAVRIGPLASVAEAEAMLARTLGSGVASARIVIQ